jgi:hypothetical protein
MDVANALAWCAPQRLAVVTRDNANIVSTNCFVRVLSEVD